MCNKAQQRELFEPGDFKLEATSRGHGLNQETLG